MNLCGQFIQNNQLLKSGDKLGVGVSGGSDSVALLHYLATNKDALKIELVAIHVDHQIRENSGQDCKFVEKLAKELGVRFCKFKIDVPALAKERGQSLETAAREARYEVFRSLVKKGIINKVALAHHKNDQAETILMHIFRGSGVSGAKGMEPTSEKIFIRPLLDCSKEDILAYLKRNKLEYVNDYTNEDIAYNRNFVRNVILKEICSRWPNAVDAIVNFGRSASEDDEYINSQVYEDAILHAEKLVKVPTSYFVFHKAVVSRIIFKALKSIGVNKDIERKHISLIIDLAQNGENGSKLSLPFNVKAVKEYDYIVFHNNQKEKSNFEATFKCGKVNVENFGTITIKKVKDKGEVQDALKSKNMFFIDGDKLPKGAKWRTRKEGDNFAKFGGGSKKLKSFLIDQKVPARIRDFLPVLANENEIFVVGGIEISEKVKVDDNTKNIYKIIFDRDN